MLDRFEEQAEKINKLIQSLNDDELNIELKKAESMQYGRLIHSIIEEKNKRLQNDGT